MRQTTTTTTSAAQISTLLDDFKTARALDACAAAATQRRQQQIDLLLAIADVRTAVTQMHADDVSAINVTIHDTTYRAANVDDMLALCAALAHINTATEMHADRSVLVRLRAAADDDLCNVREQSAERAAVAR